MTPKVSIILPAYRHERYVSEAIASALGQSLGDFELIVIDDASPDATWEVIQGFRDERIRAWRHGENQGAVRTLNEGLRLARGEYLTILNSDDTYHPRRLEVLLEAARDGGVEFVATDVELLEGGGEVMRGKGHGWIEWFEGLKDIHRWAADPVIALLSGNLAVSTSNMFFAAGVPRRIGYFYEYHYAHDYEFLLRYLADPGANFCFLDGQKLLSYRLHSANTITQSSLAVQQEVFGLLVRWLADLAPVSDRARIAAAARQLMRMEGGIEAWYRQEIETARQANEAVRQEVETARSENERLQADVSRWHQEAGTLRAERDALCGSLSFRLGRFLLWPGRFARRLWMLAR